MAIRVKDLGFRVKELGLGNVGFRVREFRVRKLGLRRGTTPNPNLLAIRVKDLGLRN